MVRVYADGAFADVGFGGAQTSAQLRELVCSFRARSSQSRAQSCREDQSSAAKRIETVLTTSPTIQPATS